MIPNTVNRIDIPDGEVEKITCNGEILWQKVRYKRELLYLEGTGTQWIDTGIDYFADFEIGIKLRNSVANKALGLSNTCCMERHSATNPYWKFQSDGRKFDSQILITEYHEIRWKEKQISCDGVVIADFEKPTTKGNFHLFKIGGNNTSYPNIVYYLKMWDTNGNLIREFIPVLDWNDRPCMYDKVSDNLFYNQGTGEFNCGEAV